jgi:hypothetical protein
MLERVSENAGLGDLIHNGTVVRRVRYRVTVHQGLLQPGGLPVPGLYRLEGSIDVDAARDAADLVGAELALRFEDGRLLGITLLDRDGRIGSCRHGFAGCGCG